MDIAILVLTASVIMLLVAIFVLLILKNKGRNGNVEELLSDNNDKLKKDIVDDIAQKYNTANSSMLDELSRNNTYLNTTLTHAISENNTHLTQTISINNGELNKTLDSFRETQEKKFISLEKKIYDKLENIQKEMTQALSNQKNDNIQSNADIRETLTNQLNNIKTENINSNTKIKETLSARLDSIDKEIAKELDKIRTENQTKLNEMRDMVDNKMQETLNARINESFKLISEQLMAVSKGLGEMTNLTTGVNNLNRIMSNVKTRGIMGEVFLENLLEQILTAEQYEKQLILKGREAVDFAIVLPGKKEDEKVYLPIDAKFPISDYQELVDASESYDKTKVDAARKNLFKRIKEEAKSISDKYIIVPKTTNFAIMYLATEGLFAEVVKDTKLLDELQNNYKVVISGPTTITALLNSLQLGFKTLQIQKNSTEVWKALSKFKTEFQKFADSLEKVEKQANTVVKTIEETSKKTKSIEKVLNKLDKIDYDPQEIGLLGGVSNGEELSDN